MLEKYINITFTNLLEHLQWKFLINENVILI